MKDMIQIFIAPPLFILVPISFIPMRSVPVYIHSFAMHNEDT